MRQARESVNPSRPTRETRRAPVVENAAPEDVAAD